MAKSKEETNTKSCIISNIKWKRTATIKITLFTLIAGLISSNLNKAIGEELYKGYKTIEYDKNAELCLSELSNSFASAYRAGKTTAAALNYRYSKMGIQERNLMSKMFLTTKAGMASTGVAVITSTKPELRPRVNCYLRAYENLNTGFISGFSDNLIPELKRVYAGVPLL